MKLVFQLFWEIKARSAEAVQLWSLSPASYLIEK
jgi:hypothetical protein